MFRPSSASPHRPLSTPTIPLAPNWVLLELFRASHRATAVLRVPIIRGAAAAAFSVLPLLRLRTVNLMTLHLSQKPACCSTLPLLPLLSHLCSCVCRLSLSALPCRFLAPTPPLERSLPSIRPNETLGAGTVWLDVFQLAKGASQTPSFYSQRSVCSQSQHSSHANKWRLFIMCAPILASSF